jgi:D-alanyl-lipoteichoic acid acyltransferase DltB (MBOAT superfamily)
VSSLLQSLLYILVFVAELALLRKLSSVLARQLALLAGSYLLYLTWSRWFLAVLLVSTVANYFLGNWARRRPHWPALTSGILLNLVLLSTFKYLPPIAVALPFSSLQRFAHLALPLGMSFWTFQAISYLFDQFQGEELDPTFLEFALYMAFFPVAISGPICRMQEMLPQFRSSQKVPWSKVERGFQRIATGVLMMQLARLLGQGILSGDGVNGGFDFATRWSGADVWCLAIGYGLQLFFDFAGYSHIAIGAAQMLGFTVPENFDLPFQATSPSAFWTRWHMSLSFWIRDYVFLPLAVVRREMWWRNAVLVFSMLLFGVWHKATVLFVLWGCYHGVLLILHRQAQGLQRRFHWEPSTQVWEAASWFVTTGLISLGWIFFRAATLIQVKQMFLAVLSPASYGSHFLSGSLYFLVAGLAAGYAIVVLVAKNVSPYSDRDRLAVLNPDSAPPPVWVRRRWFWLPPLYVLTLLVVTVVTFTQGTNAAQLVYRRF